MRWFRRREDEIDEEIRAHIRMAVQDRVRAGEDPAHARREVLREFGGVALKMEDTRAVWRWWWLDQTAADLRFALRTLGKSPGFAVAAILSLALGVGATTALLSVLHFVALRPLPYREPQRLAIAWSIDPRLTPGTSPASFPDWQDWRTATHSFAGLAAFRNRPGFLNVQERTLQLELHEVSADFLPLLGVAPVLGRFWSEREGEAGQSAVISDALWRDAFGGARDVIGRRIVVSQAPYRIVGIMPPGFTSPSVGMRTGIRLSPPDSIWTPLVAGPAQRNNRGNRGLRILARLAPGSTLAAARGDLAAVAVRLAAAYPESGPPGMTADLVPLEESVTGALRPPLAALVAASGLFLLIACANVAGLLLARDESRKREYATRSALGASRGRLVRQSLTESAVLAFAGGAAGVALAAAMLALTRRAAGMLDIARLADSSLDLPALASALAVSAAAALLFGSTPAWRVSQAAGTRITADRRSVRLRQVLVGAATAVTFVLVFSASLLVASFRNLIAGRGDANSRTYTFQVTLSGTRWARSPLDRQFYDSLLERVRGLPQVKSVGVTTGLLNIGDASGTLVSIVGAGPLPPERQPMAGYTMADGEFFRLAGLALREGRLFDAHDREGAPPVAIVNEAFVRSVSPDQDVVGRKVKLLGVGTEPMEVVGVVADGRPFRPAEQERARVFYPYSQNASPRFIGIVRVKEGAAPPMQEIRAIVREMDATLPVFEVQSVAQIVGKATSAPRWGSTLVVLFAGMSLALAAVGVMGTVGFCANQRKKECGIRLALGAAPRAVSWMVARQGVWPVVGGIAAGLAATRLVEPVVGRFLFGVPAGDPLAMLLGATLLGVASGLAALAPARRAAAVDPAATLRSD